MDDIQTRQVEVDVTMSGLEQAATDSGKPKISKGGRRSKGKRSTSSRGRSTKKKGLPKNKEPFNHIAKSLLPSTALATAVPKATNSIIRSRSPSPVVRAIVFVSKIGQAVAAGKNLTRSFSAQELATNLQNQPRMSTSKLHQGPSGEQEPLHLQKCEDTARYESIDDMDGIHHVLPSQQHSQQNRDHMSPMARRPPMPVPKKDIVKETENNVEDLYAKVSKQYTQVKSNRKGEEITNENSDEITSVSEMDNLSSKQNSSKQNIKQENVKNRQELQIEDTSDGPSEGEVYRLPFDSVLLDKLQEPHFKTIEEYTEENAACQNSYMKDVARGPSSDQTEKISAQKNISFMHLEGKEERPSTRPQTPRDLGREAALQRLEELGFDNMCKEFDIIEKNSTNDVQGIRSSSILSRSYTAARHGNKDTTSEFDSSINESNLVAEEPLMHSSEILQQYSSGEMQLDELRPPNSYYDDNEKQKLNHLQHVKMADSKTSTTTHESKMLPELDTVALHDRVPKQHHQHGIGAVKEEIVKMMQMTEDELKQQRGAQKIVIDNQAKIKDQISKLYTSIDQMSAHDPDTGYSQMADQSPSLLQKYIDAQNEMKLKQDKILDTIIALEGQLKNTANISTNDQKPQKTQEEELITLRRMIAEEQKKYIEQQKVLEEQQKKILTMQETTSHKQTKRSNSRSLDMFVTSPNIGSSDAPRFVHANKPHHFMILEDRLKSIEAERQALIDVNASMQEENDALRKIALHQFDAGPSFVVQQKHNKDLIQSNQNLKNLVHRLNMELSYFQTKYQQPCPEEVANISLSENEPIPHWMVNTKYLPPLLLAYDERLKDKNNIIHAYELQLASFKARVLEVVRENQKLHLMTDDKQGGLDSIHVDDWNLLQEQAKLLVEENSILMQEIELKDRRIEEMQQLHQLEVQKRSKQLYMAEKENKYLKGCLSNMNIDIVSWKQKYENAVAESNQRITGEELEKKLSESKRISALEVQSLQKQHENSANELQSVFRSKQELAIKLTDATSKNSALQTEFNLLAKKLKKTEKQLTIMQQKFKAAKDKEAVATRTLADVLSVAEKSAKQQDQLSHMLKTQKTKEAVRQKERKYDERKLELLENNLKKYKNMTEQKTQEAYQRLAETEDEMFKMKDCYEQEIGNLQGLLKMKQDTLRHIQFDNRQFEEEIDKIWHSVAIENEQLKTSVIN